MTLSSMLNQILSFINYGIDQAWSNAWYVFLLVLSLYVVKDQYKKVSYRASGVTLGTAVSGNGTGRSSTTKPVSSTRTNREEEMYQIRLRQQEMINDSAKEALQRQRELKKKPMDPVPTANNDNATVSSSKKYTTKTTKTTTETKTSSGYNPMQPWSASAGGGTGGTYRPSRRANPRGGG